MIEHDNASQRRSALTAEQQSLLRARIAGAGSVSDQRNSIPRSEPRQRAVMSSAQQRQWFLWKLNPGSTAYHLCGGLFLRGPLNTEALGQALDHVFDRHDSLRTTFDDGSEDYAEQVIDDNMRCTLAYVDYSGQQEAEKKERVQSEVDQLCSLPFDLNTGPLTRFMLIRTGTDEHILFVVMHHIVSDEWSTQIVLEELGHFYTAIVSQRDAYLPTPRIRYMDYADWQLNWLKTPEYKEQLDWWKKELDGADLVLNLPADTKRQPGVSYAAAQVHFDLDRALVSRLRTASAQSGGTLFMMLTAAFQAVLFLRCQQQDFCVGIPVGNRTHPDTHEVVGFFVNMQVLRAKVEPQMSLVDLFAHVKKSVLSAQSSQDVPFDRLVDALQVRRERGTHPLFQVVHNHLRRPRESMQTWSSMEVERLVLPETDAQFDLTLQTCESSDGGVDVSFVYAKELFNCDTIERLSDHFMSVLRSFVEAPETLIRQLPYLSKLEQRFLNEWGNQKSSSREGVPLHVLFERRAAERPDALAVTFEGIRLTYSELNKRANRLAHLLIRRGVERESLVGVALLRSVEMVIALLAILKAGGAYVPIDPDYPLQRLSYMVEDSGVETLITDNVAAARFPAMPAVRIIDVNDIDLARQGDLDPNIDVHEENLAYVIYTSGSTGRPKGVQICHGNVTRLLTQSSAWFEFGPNDVWTMFHSYAFDFSVWEIFGALCTGGRLIVVPFWITRSPEDFVTLLQTERVTVLNQTPSAFYQLIRAPGALGNHRLSLRLVIFGGESLDPNVLQPWWNAYQDAGPQLVNMYGITETTVHVTYRPLTPADMLLSGSPIGTAIHDLSLRVLDTSLNLAPIGVPGELFVGGAGLARSYLNRGALTADRFIADPFDAGGGRLYRTGDLARWTAQGQLEYSGRADQQVKIRGFRIELGEVQGQLLAHADVSEAVVVADEDAQGQRLIAYLATNNAQSVDVANLRKHLAAVLPDHMIPGAFVFVDAFPLNANGKLDRKALPKPQNRSETAHRAFEQPKGDVEQAIAAIWQRVLKIQMVGRHDNFFELGGDSMLSLQVVALARKRRLAMTARHMFENDTLAHIAIATEMEPHQATVVPAIGRVDRTGRLELSFAQARQWFLWNMAPESSAYHIHGVVRLEGELHVGALNRAFDDLTGRHEALRTVFRVDDLGTPVQHVLSDLPAVVEMIDLASGDPVDRELRLEHEVKTSIRRPFALDSDLLIRVRLIKVSSESHVLVVVMHHIVSDGWSLEIVMNEVVLRYSQYIKGENFLTEPALIQYADYAAWQRRWMEAGEKDRQLAYWKAKLGNDHSPLVLPYDRPRRADGRYTASTLDVKLPESLVQGLRQRAHSHGATLFNVMLACMSALLYRYSGQEQIRIGVPVANRTLPETRDVVGFFVNTLIIQTLFARKCTLSDVLAQTKSAMLGAQAHQDLPFEQLVEALQPDRAFGVSPLFQVVVNHQKLDHTALLRWPGLAVVRYSTEQPDAQFDLVINIEEDAKSQVALQLCFARELFDRGAIARLADHYVAMLRAMCDSPETAIHHVGIFSDQEERQMTAWSVGPEFHRELPLLHRAMEERVKSAPHTPAVVCGESEVTYSELNVRANKMAHRLIAMGAGPETRVGVLLDRSVELIVSLLAVLKSGGVYVPLDVNYPAERLAHMAADSGIAILIAEQEHSPITLPGVVQKLDVHTSSFSLESADNPVVNVHRESAAYVIYTSGSTGQPKGVEVSHAAFSKCIHWMQENFSFQGEEVVLHKAPVGFDVSLWEIALPLVSGSRLVVALPQEHREPERLAALIRKHEVTTASFVPSMLRAFNAALRDSESVQLRHIMCGGEAVPTTLVNETLRFFPAAEVHNLYGPTETTIHVTHWNCVAGGEGSTPIGRPIAVTEAYVLGAGFEQLPVGVVGELCIGGALLARGYLGRGGATAERFVADPNSSIGGRLYRTGDLARWNSTGQLEYLGRSDQQLKIRGFRVELGEIRVQIVAQPGVSDAAVVAKNFPDGPRIVAYVVAEDAHIIDKSGLRDALASALPDYMIPSIFMTVDTLRVTANGKLDESSLPAPVFESVDGYVAPDGAIEVALAQIWSEVLEVGTVGRHDSFFMLGGHSLSAIQVVSKVQLKLGLTISVRDVFARPTVEQMAGHLSNVGRGGALRDTLLEIDSFLDQLGARK